MAWPVPFFSKQMDGSNEHEVKQDVVLVVEESKSGARQDRE
jgi:hypothetical protein